MVRNRTNVITISLLGAVFYSTSLFAFFFAESRFGNDVDRFDEVRDLYDNSRIVKASGVYWDVLEYNENLMDSGNTYVKSERANNLFFDHAEKFTLITQVFSRPESYCHFLETYSRLHHLDKIIVVWNRQDVAPHHCEDQTITVKVQVRIEGQNTMNNRFRPDNRIMTDAVLLIDDDLLISSDDIQNLFVVWKNSRNRLVGFLPRRHEYTQEGIEYRYDVHGKHPGRYSMILVGASMFSKKFMRMYWSEEMRQARAYVTRVKNCDDVAFNFMVANFTRLPPLQAAGRVVSKQEQKSPGLSEQRDWMGQRHNCFRHLSIIFRGDPLLFNDAKLLSMKPSQSYYISKQGRAGSGGHSKERHGKESFNLVARHNNSIRERRSGTARRSDAIMFVSSRPPDFANQIFLSASLVQAHKPVHFVYSGSRASDFTICKLFVNMKCIELPLSSENHTISLSMAIVKRNVDFFLWFDSNPYHYEAVHFDAYHSAVYLALLRHHHGLDSRRAEDVTFVAHVVQTSRLGVQVSGALRYEIEDLVAFQIEAASIKYANIRFLETTHHEHLSSDLDIDRSLYDLIEYPTARVALGQQHLGLAEMLKFMKWNQCLSVSRALRDALSGGQQRQLIFWVSGQGDMTEVVDFSCLVVEQLDLSYRKRLHFDLKMVFVFDMQMDQFVCNSTLPFEVVSYGSVDTPHSGLSALLADALSEANAKDEIARALVLNNIGESSAELFRFLPLIRDASLLGVPLVLPEALLPFTGGGKLIASFDPHSTPTFIRAIIETTNGLSHYSTYSFVDLFANSSTQIFEMLEDSVGDSVRIHKTLDACDGNKLPKVTVVIVTKSGSDTLYGAVQSLVASLEKIEVLIIDVSGEGRRDGKLPRSYMHFSERNTTTLKQGKVRFHFLGASATVQEARNFGARAASSQLLLLIDEFVTLPQDSLRAALCIMEEKHCDAIFGWSRTVQSLPIEMSLGLGLPAAAFDNTHTESAGLFRRDAFLGIDGHSTEGSAACGSDLYDMFLIMDMLGSNMCLLPMLFYEVNNKKKEKTNTGSKQGHNPCGAHEKWIDRLDPKFRGLVELGLRHEQLAR